MDLRNRDVLKRLQMTGPFTTGFTSIFVQYSLYSNGFTTIRKIAEEFDLRDGFLLSLSQCSSCFMESLPSERSYPMMDHVHNRLLLADEQKVEGIKSPHHNDVLCGRGVTTNRHPGNESFRSLVSLNKVRPCRDG